MISDSEVGVVRFYWLIVRVCGWMIVGDNEWSWLDDSEREYEGQ